MYDLPNSCPNFEQKNMIEIFEKLGLSSEESQIMQSIIKNGPQTILQISRTTNIKRTNVYRIVEQLESNGYVFKKVGNGSNTYAPLSLLYLNQKIEEKEAEAKSLQSLFKLSKNDLQQYYSRNINNIGANYYNGSEEVKQLIWNSLSTNNKEIKSFGYRSLKTAVGMKFMAQWWNESIMRGITHIMIANPETYIEKKNADKDEKIKYIKSPANQFQKRVLPITDLEITTETFIYNNTYSIIQWSDDDVFGVEIINDSIRRQEEQVFDFLWKKAEKY
jgi:sugar-specific transcriptional regulator TrmB